MAKSRKVTPEKKFTVTNTELFNICKSLITKSEERIKQNVLLDVRNTIHNEPQYEPITVHQAPAEQQKQVRFAMLTGGSVFKLSNGTQPIVKLEFPTWGARAPFDANAFYLKTGSTCRIEPWKEVVPLKCSVTIDS